MSLMKDALGCSPPTLNRVRPYLTSAPASRQANTVCMFVSSAALVSKRTIQMWARHGDSISVQSFSYGGAVKPCMFMDNAGSSKDRLFPTTSPVGRVALFPKD